MAKILAELVPKMTRQYFRTYVFFFILLLVFLGFFLYFVIVIPASFPFSIGVGILELLLFYDGLFRSSKPCVHKYTLFKLSVPYNTSSNVSESQYIPLSLPNSG